jgi:hypothetical protein
LRHRRLTSAAPHPHFGEVVELHVDMALGPLAGRAGVLALGPVRPTRPGEEVPILDVKEALRKARKRRRAQTIVADPFRWARAFAAVPRRRGATRRGVPAEPATGGPGNAAVQGGHIQPGVDRLRRPGPGPARRLRRREGRLPRALDRKEHKNSAHRIDRAAASAAASTVQPGPQLFVFDEADT